MSIKKLLLTLSVSFFLIFLLLTLGNKSINFSDEKIFRIAITSIKFSALSKHYIDQDFIDMTDQKIVDSITSDFINRYPDCCKVYRNWGADVFNINPILWKYGVIVKIENEARVLARRTGTSLPNYNGTYFVLVTERGSEVLKHYIPGG